MWVENESSQTFHSFQEWAALTLGPKWREESKPSATAKTIATRKASSGPESQTVDLTEVPFGTMLTISTGNPGKEQTSLAEDFPVPTFPLPVNAQESKSVQGPAFSMNLCAFVAKYDPDSSSWRTSQGSLFTREPIEFSENWPAWGLMLAGKLYPHPMSGQIIGDSESGLWPTPSASQARSEGMIMQMRAKVDAGEITLEEAENMIAGSLTPDRMKSWPTPRANDAEKRGQVSDDPRNGLPGQVLKFPTPRAQDGEKMGTGSLGDTKMLWPTPKLPRGDCPSERKRKTPSLESVVNMYPTPGANDWKGPNMSNSGSQSSKGLATKTGGQLNPEFVEWLMNWPSGWTALNAVETESFLNSRVRRGKRSRESLYKGVKKKNMPKKKSKDLLECKGKKNAKQ